jgi:hypothetical protein
MHGTMNVKKQKYLDCRTRYQLTEKDLKEMGSVAVEWIHPTLRIFQQQPFVNIAT